MSNAQATRSLSAEKESVPTAPPRSGVHRAPVRATDRFEEPPTDFIDFLRARMSVSRETATDVLGSLLSNYEARERYEICVLEPGNRDAA